MNRHEIDLSEEEARKRAARGVMSVFGRHAVVRLVAFLGTLVLARLIAPDSFGLFITAQFALSVLQALSVGGITSALVRRREAIDETDWRTALVVQQISAIVVVVALYFAAPFVVSAYGLPEERSTVFRVMALAVFPHSLRSIPLAMLQRGLRHDLAALVEVLEYVVQLVVSVGLALLGADVWALVAATLARQVVGAIAMQWMSRTFPRVGFAADRVAALLRTAIPLQGQMLVDLAQRSIIPVVVGFLFGVAAVGVVGMANTMFEALVLQPLVMLGSVQLRMFARVQNSPKDTCALLDACYSAGAMFFLPAIVLTGIFAPMIMPHLLSVKWADVGRLMSWLALASALQIVALPTAQAAKALGKLKAPLSGGLLNLGLQTVVLLTTSSIFGLGAYPLAATVGLLAGTTYVYLRVAAGLPEHPVKALVPIVAANVTAGAIWFHASTLSPALLVVESIAGVIVYIGLVVVLAGDRLGKALRFFGEVGPQRFRAACGWLAVRVERRNHSLFKSEGED